MISILDLLPEARAAQPDAWRADEAHTVGWLYQIDETGTRATISIYGSEPITVPCAPSIYTGVDAVHVLMQNGRPTLVLGPATPPEDDPDPEDSDVPDGPPPVEEDDDGDVVAPPAPDRRIRGKLIRPTWSGSYRQSRGTWNSWNTHDDLTNLYQGSTSSSGTLIGLAVYGTLIRDLGAKSIERVRLTLVSQGRYGYGSPITYGVRGASNGTRPSGAPSLTGATSTVAVPGYGQAGKTATLDLPASVCEGMRTGAIRGLALVGSAWGALRGTSHAAGMALSIDYTVAAK